MIVELSFGDVDAGEWRDVLCATGVSGRVTLSASLDLESPYSIMAAQWFEDEEQLGRDRVELTDATTVVATPEVRRGAGWLEARWRDGGPRYKHVAVARRAEGLSLEEFGERWRSHAGSVGSPPIPDAARGQAYVQNHPVDPGMFRSSSGTVRVVNELSGGGWAYDAVTEVWFDELDDLRRRVEWMDGALAAGPGDLFGAHHLFAVREELL